MVDATVGAVEPVDFEPVVVVGRVCWCLVRVGPYLVESDVRSHGALVHALLLLDDRHARA